MVEELRKPAKGEILIPEGQHDDLSTCELKNALRVQWKSRQRPKYAPFVITSSRE
jgi:hypothetical protein